MRYPALDVRCADAGLLLALVDDYGPSAVEERGGVMRVFFPDAEARAAAQNAIAHEFLTERVDVPDEDWARRSQEHLVPVVVGRITVAPPWHALAPDPPDMPDQPRMRIVIAPSMGFGTGHHATTRLCLAALQTIDLAGKRLLDVGTGSGVLAIAARLLGAEAAVGIDTDPDAVQAARENLVLNPGIIGVSFEASSLETALDVGRANRFPADVITANLTGALLIRSASRFCNAAPGARLILSGVLTDEREAVLRAFGPAAVEWEAGEDGWVGAMLRLPDLERTHGENPRRNSTV